MHPRCFPAYTLACFKAGINPEKGTRPNGKPGSRIMQILGDAEASAGTHASDGTYRNSKGQEIQYCAAIDVRSTDLSIPECDRLQLAFIECGFAAYRRYYGKFANNQHFHIIYQDVPMKRSLRNQSHSFYRRRNGLVGDAPEPFLQKLPDSAFNRCRTYFLNNNPAVGLGQWEIEEPEEGDLICCAHFDPDTEGVEFTEED